MARRGIPPISRILGIVDNVESLPAHGEAGDAWYEEAHGLLWIWDHDHKKWFEIGRLQNASPGLIASFAEAVGLSGGAAGSAGAAGSRGAAGERGPAGPKGDRGEIGPIGPAGKDGAPGRDGAPGKDGKPGGEGLDADLSDRAP